MVATMRGIPQIFYGEELMFVSKDRSQGHGGLRLDFPGGWADDTQDFFNESNLQGNQKELFQYYKYLLNWRKGEEVIHSGKTLHFLSRDNTYAYFRYNGEKAVFVYLNASTEEKEIPWSNYQELLNLYQPMGKSIFNNQQIDTNSSYKVEAKGIRIIEFVTPK